jgi:hypothetical protein
MFELTKFRENLNLLFAKFEALVEFEEGPEVKMNRMFSSIIGPPIDKRSK